MILSNITLGDNVNIHPSTFINNVAFGDNIKIAKECIIQGGQNNILKVGSGCIVGMYVTIDASQADIEIGENVSVAQHTVIVSNWGLVPGSSVNKLFDPPAAPIKIGSNCWIGSGTVIAPGVSIGKFCIIASNSYVDVDVPDFSIYGGNPARFIRSIDPKEIDYKEGE